LAIDENAVLIYDGFGEFLVCLWQY